MRERLNNDVEVHASPVTDVKKIMEDVVVLNLVFHRPGIHRRGDIEQVETESDKKMLRLSKEIVDSEEYTVVTALAGEARGWIRKRSLPSPLKRGTFLIPLGLVDTVNSYLDEVESRYNSKAENFLAVYPQKVQEAKSRLRGQFDDRNYPSVGQMRSAFWLERSFLDFGVPSEQKIGRELWRQEKARAEKTWSATVEEIQDALRTSFRALVGHMAERLEPKPDGKRKIFKNTAIDKITEFIDLFQARNITNDAELEGLVAQARNVLAGKNPDSIRKSDVVRGEIAGEMVRVTTALDQLLIDSPRRQISFDDDE